MIVVIVVDKVGGGGRGGGGSRRKVIPRSNQREVGKVTEHRAMLSLQGSSRCNFHQRVESKYELLLSLLGGEGKREECGGEGKEGGHWSERTHENGWLNGVLGEEEKEEEEEEEEEVLQRIFRSSLR